MPEWDHDDWEHVQSASMWPCVSVLIVMAAIAYLLVRLVWR